MWLIGLAVALNLVGLLVAARAVFRLYGERGIENGGSLSLHGVGLTALLLGGCLLMGSGQYQALALLYTSPEERYLVDLDPVVKAGVICGLVLVALGSVLARGRRASGDAPAGGGARGMAAVGAALLALAALNVYQYASHTRQAFDANQPARGERPATAIEVDAVRTMADEEIVREFARRFHDRVFAPGDKRPRFLGIETLQNPNDAWTQQEIIHAVKPDFIIETGTYNGGSALLWATILREVNPKGRVLTVDVTDSSADARNFDIWRERIDFFLGSSTDPQIVADITKRVSGGRVLVILDSHHGYEHVLQELRMYSPLVSLASYIVVQDTYIDYPPAFHPHLGPGPWAAVEKFLTETDRFVIDESRERMLFTFNPKSQLKRIK